MPSGENDIYQSKTIRAVKNMNKLLLNIEIEGLKDKVFVAGFHGIGSVGWITVNFLVEKLKARRIGIIITEKMPSFVSRKGGYILTPYEFYLFDNFIFLKCNMPIVPETSENVLANVVDFIEKGVIKEAFLVGGLDSRLKKEGDSRVRFVHTENLTEDLKRKLSENENMVYLDEGLYIVGPLATLLTYFEAYRIPAVTVLPYARVDRPDPEAALEAAKVFAHIYGLELDYSDLIEQAAEIEKYLSEVQKKLEEMKERESRLIYI
ncbi:MAG: hypothetical protein DRJ37_04460 [Thermoprotei archaeon]|nr:MAG: hypothetical protein DRJ37_04460 [Thermoprotei archaeon]